MVNEVWMGLKLRGQVAAAGQVRLEPVIGSPLVHHGCLSHVSDFNHICNCIQSKPEVITTGLSTV